MEQHSQPPVTMIKILCKIWITLKLNINVLHFLQHIWITEKLSRWYKVFLYTFTPPHHKRVSPIINIFTATAAAAAAKSLQLCPTLRPIRRPTRLPCPWDSPGKNTGVGCHFLLQCIKMKSESEVGQSCPTLSNRMGCSLPGSSIQGIF